MTVESSAYWNEQYSKGYTPWDLGAATPVFTRLAASRRFEPGRMIVLGAGQGHDARLFARHGFAVTAVDFAPQAVAAMHAGHDPQAPLDIVQENIFELPADFAGSFDYVLEYTCYCAINPTLRGAYYDLVEDLLAPGGIYIALAFPIGSRAGGPPFVVSPPDMIAALRRRGLKLLHREQPADSAPGRQGIEELIIMGKADSSSAGPENPSMSNKER